MNKTKYLIDTDLGDDIDDVLAIYAAMKRNMDIIGITTVFLNTDDRARMAKKLCKDFGHGYENVPVYVGHGRPLMSPDIVQKHVPHYSQELASEMYTPDGSMPDDAVQFILESCRTYGEELTIIGIGPFTNLAKAIEADPVAMSKPRVIIMGGAYFKQYADWNVMCDVEAAEKVFSSLPRLECIGADVTHQMKAPDEMFQHLFYPPKSSPAADYMAQLCRLWKQDRPTCEMLLHDPLVVYYAEIPALCTMKETEVAVITKGYARGITLNVRAYGKKQMNADAYADCAFTSCFVAETAEREAFRDYIRKDILSE